MNKPKVILFDLDGTLLPMDNDLFTKAYFSLLCKKMAKYGYEPERLVNTIWTGTKAMVLNDGHVSNEEAFWNKAKEIYPNIENDKPLFDEFYAHEFEQAQASCSYSQDATDLIHWLKENGYRMALATNPIFPHTATEARMRWAGLNAEDFELYTTYENIGYCKPNPEYYMEITRRLGVTPKECMMVGNDVDEDMMTQAMGMEVFLIEEHMINRKNRPIDSYPRGDFKQLLSNFKNSL